MRLQPRLWVRVSALIVGSMIVGGLMTGTAMAYYDEHIHFALRDLNKAYADLNVQNGISYGGHRAAARNLVSQAIVEVQAAIAVAGQ